MAKRKSGRPVGVWLGIPTVLSSGAFAAIAVENTLAAGLSGALVGFFIGIGLLAFPNLDRGGPDDTDDMLH